MTPSFTTLASRKWAVDARRNVILRKGYRDKLLSHDVEETNCEEACYYARESHAGSKQ
jgi:hypothetical protein